ncbi:tripartite tricarboxylate transporter TctB family protein [Dactylosporangium sp. AC04546]|uniref:tripartite tricarboxylate transporter TctB family protein n=1 Tax=Dactylosporangium sp. AC04546 TaxID=2862460 RepID=UPI001EDD131B|nr:tripartite tricarboxylate transporter TctB family protein [Dactylosporangium sp. AC04546]WVK79518.1 tripartite tricarboxylate transporter TctB family protein [Dactylosporangium sp. AC04546]
MINFRPAHVVFSAVWVVIFAAMAMTSLTYADKASWFPLYTGIAGGAVSLIATVVGAIAVARHHKSDRTVVAAAVEADTEPEHGAERAVVPAAVGAHAGGNEASTAASREPARVGDDDALVETAEAVHPAGEDHDETLTDRQALLRGFAWLTTWVAFALSFLLIGFLASSLVFLAVWFRTVVKWPWKVLVPVLVAGGVLIYLAETEVGMAMPGGYGWIGDALGM